jgi:V8-like Glu-specific endopeptidase
VSIRRSKAAIAVGLLAALTLVPMVAAPAAAKNGPDVEHARILKYWTAERIAHAMPRDFVRDSNGHFSMAKPTKGKPGGGGGTGTTVLGASWNGGGAVLSRTGKVVFTMDSGDYICTGTVVTDSKTDRAIVVTAGHCSYDGEDGGFARNWMFIPEFDSAPTYTCAQSKYGCWTAKGLATHRGFKDAGGFNTQATTYDWSFAFVGTGGKTNVQLDTLLGTMPISFTAPKVGDQTFNFGYPAAGKYHGSDLIYCADQIFNDPLNANLTFGVDCDMTGGSSGGPWFAGFNQTTGVGTVDSVNSYGYSGVKKEYGPKFNANTSATYNAALNASLTGGNVFVGTAP